MVGLSLLSAKQQSHENKTGSRQFSSCDYADEWPDSTADYPEDSDYLFVRFHGMDEQIITIQVLARFEPVALRLQMLLRRTQGWRHRASENTVSIPFMNVSSAHFNEIVRNHPDHQQESEEVPIDSPDIIWR